MPEQQRRSKYTKEQIAAINKKRQEQRKAGNKKRGKWHWFLTLHIIGLLTAPVSFFFLSFMIVISWWEIALITAGIGLVSVAAQFHYFKKKKLISDNLQLTNPLFLSYNFLGVGLLGLCLFFTLNQTLASSEIIQETHHIVGTDPEYQIYRWGSVVFLLENDVFSNDVQLRAISYTVYLDYKDVPYMEYDFRMGLLGYKVKVDHRIAKSIPAGE